MFYALTSWLPSLSQHFLVGVLAVLAYVLTTRLRREQRAPTTAIAWVTGLALMPYVVLPMYLMFGSRKLRPAGSPRAPRTTPSSHWAAELIESFGLAPRVRQLIAGWVLRLQYKQRVSGGFSVFL